MPINVFGYSSSSHGDGNKYDTSLFVQKPYLRTIYIESNNEKDITMKNQELRIYLFRYKLQTLFVNRISIVV